MQLTFLEVRRYSPAAAVARIVAPRATHQGSLCKARNPQGTSLRLSPANRFCSLHTLWPALRTRSPSHTCSSASTWRTHIHLFIMHACVVAMLIRELAPKSRHLLLTPHQLTATQQPTEMDKLKQKIQSMRDEIDAEVAKNDALAAKLKETEARLNQVGQSCEIYMLHV